jgi:hypothetical protein
MNRTYFLMVMVPPQPMLHLPIEEQKKKFEKKFFFYTNLDQSDVPDKKFFFIVNGIFFINVGVLRVRG